MRAGGLILTLALVELAIPVPRAGLLVADQKKPGEYSVVAGTVFRDNGLALAGVMVSLRPKTAAGKIKPMTAVSDARGEFAFRVAPVSGEYVVRASMKGFAPAEKEAAIAGPGERNEVTLVLAAESK